MAIKTDVQLKSDLDANIKTNGVNSITGTVLNYYETDLLESKVSIIDNETINGVKTFGSFPVSPESSPSTDYQMANKKYVDDTIPTSSNYVDLTTAQSVGGVKTFTDFPVSPYSAPTTDYQVANKKYVDDTVGGQILKIRFHLSEPNVTQLGTQKALLVAAGAGTYIRIFNIDMLITVTTQLEVGSQDLEIIYQDAGAGSPICTFTNGSVESASTARYTCVFSSKEAPIVENKGIYAILSTPADVTSGSATMDFQITYEVLTY